MTHQQSPSLPQDNSIQAKALSIVLGAPGDFRNDFATWLEKNWNVYGAFQGYATNIYEAGHRRYSSKTIIEAIRYHSSVREIDGAYRINNNFTPDLARLFDILNPAMAGMFVFRVNAQHVSKPRTSRPAASAAKRRSPHMM